MKQNNSSLFQKHCEQVIEKLSQECIDDFKATKDEESRIKVLYDKARNIQIHISENNGKDLNAAQTTKIRGNEYFSKKDYENALKSYNKGIVVCPQDTLEDRQLLTILISNRSATYFELKQYKKVFNDIDYLMEVGDYPSHLMHKIWLRKAKCYDELQNERSSSEAYKQAIQSLKHSKLNDKAIKNKTEEIQNCMKNNKNKKKGGGQAVTTNKEVIPYTNPDQFTGGTEYIAAHTKITVAQDNVQGRYATALENIDAGTILVSETPYCAVLDAQHALTNCQYCAVSVEQPIACGTCADVVFCSSNCQRLANKSFHAVECGIQEPMYESGVSVNCCLALRMISQKPFSLFKDKMNKLKDFLKDECKKNMVKKKSYRSDDYDNVFFLCRNEHIRKKEELIHYTCMAVYLLRLLKFANFFGKSEDETLSDDETFIGSLILRHLQLLQFNAHEVSELQNASKTSEKTTSLGVGTNCGYENVTIGAAVYPTLALFNHSCDPSIVRYNISNKVVVRAIKPIKAGDTIYENYGPLYMSQPLEKRQEELKNNYWFECLCQPCVEMWPTFQEMNEFALRIPCKTDRCPYVFNVQADDDPFLTCEYCQKSTNLLPYLKGLMVLDQILPEAEHLLSKGQLENATTKFLKALEILYKYSKPPHPEIIKVQQRIRTCFVHLGNKCWNYKTLNQ